MFTPRKNISLDSSLIKTRCCSFHFSPRVNIDLFWVFSPSISGIHFSISTQTRWSKYQHNLKQATRLLQTDRCKWYKNVCITIVQGNIYCFLHFSQRYCWFIHFCARLHIILFFLVIFHFVEYVFVLLQSLLSLLYYFAIYQVRLNTLPQYVHACIARLNWLFFHEFRG